MNRSSEVEVKVGIFVSLGLALIMLTILMLGGGQSIFSRTIDFHARFHQIEGLVEGAIVKVAGVKVGQVSKIQFIKDSGDIDVTFFVNSKYKDVVHQDSLVGIQTQGMLGDRYLIVGTGTPGSPVAKAGSELKTEPPKDLKDYLSDADEVLDRLKTSLGHMEGILGSFHRESRAETFFRNMASASSRVNDGTKGLHESMGHFQSIMAKVDRGEGTIGALINDPALYDDLRALLGGANRNRVLKYFIKKSVEESREASKDEKK